MNAPEITTDQARAYVKAHGLSGCPACGCDAIEGQSYDYETGTIYQPMTCTECGADWVDCYELDRLLEFDLTGDSL